MPLPVISTPTYELYLPVTGKKIKYRPFLVKEEKILIIAMESEDEKQIGRAVKDVLSNCILTRGMLRSINFPLLRLSIYSCMLEVSL